MSVTAIVGANWGDEGKGKTTDYLAAHADVVVRFQGGSNAGHTIINSYGKFVLHLLPSGLFYPHVTNVLGPGVALHIPTLLDELAALTAHVGALQADLPQEPATQCAPRILISDRAQVVAPYHLLLDAYEEERLADQQFGSTKRGIAPFYADKYLKLGIQVADLFDEARLFARVAAALTPKNVLFEHLYARPRLDVESIVDELLVQGQQIRAYVEDTVTFLHDQRQAGKTILLEGQLGALRDPDHGIYPYPTSSSTLAGFGAVGAGLPPAAITRVVAVAKAYSSCVGAGPFVSELLGPEGEELRRRGGDSGEYGATTGRARRVGWFDVVATRYGCRVQGATEVALTLLDVLGYLAEIPVCVAYEIDGKRVDSFPTTAALERATPVLETLPGWRRDISSIRRFTDLPAAAQNYVRKVEAWIDAPIRMLSVGPQRDAMIQM